MKVEWIATFLIALIGTFLMGLSVQTTRELSVTVESMKNRMQSQEDQLAATKSQMNSVAGELTRIKETQAVVTQQNLQDQVQEIIRLDREKQLALLEEKSRFRKLEDKYKTEKSRLQKLQSQIDLAKHQLDLADKNVEVEILTSVVESSVQKKMDNFSQSTSVVNSKAMNDVSKASLKGADRFGEAPYRETVSVQPTHDTSKDSSAVPQPLMAKKSALLEERKKLVTQQRTLDEDKRKLANNVAALKQQMQLSSLAN